MTSIAHTLSQLQAHHLSRLEAQRLLLHALGRPDHDRAWLLSHDTDTLPEATQARLDALVQRFVGGEPLAYLLGQQAFYGLTLQVDARVLVPRPDTETLVDWTLALLHGQPDAHVLDLGTGSGAIALALKAQRPRWHVSAVDASAGALAVALANATRLQLDVGFSQGSWLTQTTGHFHAIVSNPPYIEDQDPHLPALAHEPLEALTSGSDGLDDIRAIIAQAPEHLHPGGWLLMEHGYNQAGTVRALLAQAGFRSVTSHRDLAGIERCSGGQALPDNRDAASVK